MAGWIGRTLSKVEIQKSLGRGGMAEVYLGRHTTLNRPVAVKFLHSYLVDDSQLLERFRNEAQAVAALRHPNIVQVFDFDVVDGQPYMVMELLQGVSLADYLLAQRRAGQSLPLATAARIIADLAPALDYAHARGIVHRDIKPANIMLRREGGPIDLAAPLPFDARPVLTDFGVARIADAASHTVSGTITGTPAYMSPEQARGEAVDGRSDLYSLGIVLYEMLTGRPPFGAENSTPASVLVQQITTPPPNLSCDCPELQSVVDRALAKDRAARYQTAAGFAADLQKALGLLAAASPTQHTLPASSLTSARAQTLPVRPVSPVRRASLWLLLGGVVLVVVVLAGAAFVLAGAAVMLAPRLLSARPTASPPIVTAQDLGNFSFRSGTGSIDKVIISARLPPLPANKQYKAWLVSKESETREALGYLGSDGKLVYVDPTGRNLLGLFDGFEISVQPNPDPNPNPSGQVAASGSLPPQALAHIRHVLYSFGSAPGKIGLGVGLLRDAELLNSTALAMQTSQQQGDMAEMRRNAEALVNLIVGQNSEDYGDLDGDGKTVDPGDGFGLLLNGTNPGYIAGTRDHADFAAQSPDATPNVKAHAAHVEICTQNLSEWATELRDLGKQIVASADTQAAQASVAKVISLSKTFLNGQDLDGNESIDPVKGEGGAKAAIEHAQYMADLPLLAGKGQTPVPALHTHSNP